MAKQDKEFVRDLTPMTEDYARWYVDVVRKADLADYTTIKGCMVIKPYGYALWENLRDALDRRIKATGHLNAYFPLFVPESLLKMEASHVEGFAPEVAWVTQAGQEPLEERLAIRPTSEAIIGSVYAKWVQSYRDLPLLINQWANVVRWEKRTRLFLRTSEFLWQEGHTCHRTYEEAQEETLRMLEVYREFVETELAIPVIPGVKTASERFAGAMETYCIEALMNDCQALQAGTSHNLGQNFAKVFGIKFLDVDNTEKFVWQTSWGVSTRLVGGIVMVHGDDFGLKLPPRVAPYQAVVVPITFGEATKPMVLEAAGKVVDSLRGAGVRTHFDNRDNLKPGFKFNEWELKGAPLRVEVGPKDIEKKQAVVARRIDRRKDFVPLDDLPKAVPTRLDEIQTEMLEAARRFVRANTHRVQSYEEFKQVIEEKKGFIEAGWDGTPESEAQVKDDTKATIRCIPLQGGEPDGLIDLVSGKPAKHKVLFARAY
ncbi:MAG: proline--tRNA ligase [Candidatus Sumerlaeota bacterium]|nr:proline--tRNA ligase [Candidatus Sumerlaeota bacterium]